MLEKSKDTFMHLKTKGVYKNIYCKGITLIL